jgi:precorrin-2/cobalt-factor-2 C20-methyltransferase
MRARVWGVGVGPGEPDLLTLRAARCIAGAATVCYIAANARPSRARAIAAEHIPEGAEEIALPVPMSTDRREADAEYARAADRLRAEIAAGRDVAVLCEGDPLFYASFGYLREHLGESVPVSVIPGLTSVGAATARLGIPFTRQDDSHAVLTAASTDAAIADALAKHDALALLKAGPHRPRLAQLIREAERAAHAVYLEQIGYDNEAVYRGLDALPEGKGGYFGLFLVYPEASA